MEPPQTHTPEIIILLVSTRAELSDCLEKKEVCDRPVQIVAATEQDSRLGFKQPKHIHEERPFISELILIVKI